MIKLGILIATVDALLLYVLSFAAESFTVLEALR